MSVLSDLAKKFGVKPWVLWVVCVAVGVVAAKVFLF